LIFVCFAVCFALAVCLANGAAWAQVSPFVGDWKLNPAKTVLTDVMEVTGVGGNKYGFDLGGGTVETIAVDGTDQPGNNGTTLSVTVEGPNTWKVVRKKDGRVMITATWTLSEDGTTMTDDFTGMGANGAAVNLKYLYKRKAAGSGFAATWVSTSEQVTSVFVIQIRPYEGDGLSLIDTAEAVTTNVKFDEKDYPIVGANVPAGVVSSARRVSERSVEMTNKSNGKVTNTQEIVVSDDGKTLTMTVHVVGRDEPQVLVFERQ
jgi:hypothetical protein